MEPEVGFSNRLRKALKDARLTQEDLAKRLGVSRASVGHWVTGQRTCDDDTVQALAAALRVDVQWLRGEPTTVPESAVVQWHFPEPIPGQRDFGNANVWTVPADIATLVREAGQNSRDAADDEAQSIVMRFRLIELRGAEVQAFKDAAKWDDLRAHLQRAAKMRGKLARKLAAGLERVEGSRDRLLLLRIDDFGTRGLTGPEAGSGSFAALVRNNLDSEKQSSGSGGSFGLGKAAHWRCSDVSTVFFNTVTQTHAARVIARSELTFHELGGLEFAGPGWFGRTNGDDYAKSVNDTDLARRLHLERDSLPEKLRSLLPTEQGASILIVAFQDPASEELDDPSAIVEEIERQVALNFWPALRRGKLAVLVEHQVGGHVSTQLVDPLKFVPDLCHIFDKHTASDTVDAFEGDGDVVALQIPLRLPRCKHDQPDVLKHGAIDTDGTLVVGLVDPDEFADAALSRLTPSDAARMRLRKSLVNTVAMVRGPLMVTQYAKKEGIMVGARPFFAVLLAGDAAGPSRESQYAEQFLRASEPPAHDRWMFTDDLREMYERGARSRLEDFLGRDLGNALRKLLRAPARDESDGPEELKKLLRLGTDPGTSGREGLAVLRNVMPNFLGTHWYVKADVLIKKGDEKLEISPFVSMNVESGKPLRVKWQSLELVTKTLSIKKKADSFVTDGSITRFTFKGLTEPTDVPVDPRRCTARVALAVAKRGAA